MKLDFETWITTQNLPDDAVSLFNESILCYRVGAYRAAFLMSYLGFMKELKNRLLKSDKPSVLAEKRWKSIRQELLDENRWESTVFNTTQEAEGKVYLITTDLKDDMNYWRRKRNECAHAKDTIIGYSHIDMFWLFLQSNLAKFVVNGGREALLSKIRKHFDKNYTDPDTDVSYLIKDITLVVKIQEIPELLKEIYDNYVEIEELFPGRREYLFWKEIVYSTNQNLRKAFLEFIESNNDIFSIFIAIFPDILVEFSNKKDLIRLFWNKLLFEKISFFADTYWELVAIVLRNKWIPTNEIQSFIERVYKIFYDWSVPEAEQTKVLKEYGFLDLIKKEIFENGKLNQRGGYQAANDLTYKIEFYLDNEELDLLVVRELNMIFIGLKYGRFFTMMENYIQKHPRFLRKFREIATEQNLELAEFFKEKSEVINS